MNPEVAQNAGCCSTPFCEGKELEELKNKNKRTLVSLVGEFEIPNYKLKELGIEQFSKERLKTYKGLLWNGEKEKVIEELEEENNFRKYLEKHSSRLLNYSEH